MMSLEDASTKTPPTSLVALSGDDPLFVVLRTALSGAESDWTVRLSPPWCYVRPHDSPGLPPSGWKLHVSATVACAPAVLAEVMPILLKYRITFKLAAPTARLVQINAPTSPRESSGKFMTIYPIDSAIAVKLAQECDAATSRPDLVGPVILSDLQYSPTSLVHYRYGALAGEREFTDDGILASVIRNPQGEPVVDVRLPWPVVPPWLSDPLAPSAQPRGSATAHKLGGASLGVPQVALESELRVLLTDRYLVHECLKASNRGGVYGAVDIKGDQDVIVKEARAHVPSHFKTGDARDALRREAAMLITYGDPQRSPVYLDEFEQEEHFFLVESRVEGVPLRQLLRAEESAHLPDQTKALQIARALVRLVASFHRRGVVVRDVTPNNVMVAESTGAPMVRIVDFELMHRLGESCGEDGRCTHGGIGTPGYAPPEQLGGAEVAITDDLYALGATMFYLFTGEDPVPFMDPCLGEQAEPRDPRAFRMSESGLKRAVNEKLLDSRLVSLIAGAMASGASQRWPIDRMEQALARLSLSNNGPRNLTAERWTYLHRRPPDRATGQEFAQVVPDCVRWLVMTLDSSAKGFPWATTSGYKREVDPISVQTGIAGSLLFLSRVAATRPDLREAKRLSSSAVDWIVARIDSQPKSTESLYFGAVGAGWAVAEAADALRREDWAEWARERTLITEPVRTNPDICHGTAGVGLAFLRQWLRTRDDRFLERAVASGEHLLRTTTSTEAGPVWELPRSSRSEMSGTFYGFAHGSAGIAYFLACLGLAASADRYLDQAQQAFGPIFSAMVLREGGAYWPVGPGKAPSPQDRWPFWCNGASGTGTSAIRLYAITGDQRYYTLAVAAVKAALSYPWSRPLSQCHGLAGNGEFALDMCEITGDRGYHVAAERLAEIVYARASYVPDASSDGGHVMCFRGDGPHISCGFNTGTTGIASFMLRLTEGGRRALMLDELLEARELRDIGGTDKPPTRREPHRD